MTIYNVHKTNKNSPPIEIGESQIDQSTDITLFGRKRLKYGQQMNQNILHLLENFSCPELRNNKGNPDLNIAAKDDISGLAFLSNPIQGQLWYNSTQKALFSWDNTTYKWLPVGMADDIAANWGIIYDGETLPKPISATTGHVFDYDECSWIVSPYEYPAELDYMLCESDEFAVVKSVYSVTGTTSITRAFASYLIVGIRDNGNMGSISPIPSFTPTPTRTLTPTPSITMPVTTSVPVTPTPTPIPVTPTPTPEPEYTGILRASISNPDAFGDWYAGEVNNWYALDKKSIRYPGITDRKYVIRYTTNGGPNNPWNSEGGKYYVYINLTDADDGISFPVSNASRNKFIFVSTDGINGIFYKVLGFTNSGGFWKIELDTSASEGQYFNRPPVEVSSIPELSFSNYLYVYEVISNDPPSDNISAFDLTPPNHVQRFDLTILGGTPPYYVTKIEKRSTITQGKIGAITGSGMNGANFESSPIRFDDVNANSFNWEGEISLSNPNVTQITNGYKVSDFITTDLWWIYGEVTPEKCTPQRLWWFEGPTGCTNVSTGCVTSTGCLTDKTFGLLDVEITDSADPPATIFVPIVSGWQFQTIDYKYPDNTIGYSVSITGDVETGETVTEAGVVSFDLNLTMNNPVTSIRPEQRMSQNKYYFSITKPSSSTGTGNWATETAIPPSSGTHCYAPSALALAHVGDDEVFTGSPLSPNTYNESNPLTTDTGSCQNVVISSYVDSFGNVVNMGPSTSYPTPIILKLYPTSTPNTFTWNALGNSISDTSPDVPYDMKLDIILPAGIPAGSLRIPVAIEVYDKTTGDCNGGASEGTTYFISINFDT